MNQSVINDSTLIDIANAIRAKKGSEDPILAEDMASEIASIQSGAPSDGGQAKRYLVKETVFQNNYTEPFAEPQVGVTYHYVFNGKEVYSATYDGRDPIMVETTHGTIYISSVGDGCYGAEEVWGCDGATLSIFSYEGEGVREDEKTYLLKGAYITDTPGLYTSPAPVPNTLLLAIIDPGNGSAPVVMEALCDEDGYVYFYGDCTENGDYAALVYYPGEDGWHFHPIDSNVSGATVTVYSYDSQDGGSGDIHCCPNCGSEYGTQEEADSCCEFFYCPNCGCEYETQEEADSCCGSFYCPNCGSAYGTQEEADSCCGSFYCDYCEYEYDNESDAYYCCRTSECPVCGEMYHTEEEANECCKLNCEVFFGKDGKLSYEVDGWTREENEWHLYDGQGNLIAEETATYYNEVDLSSFMEQGCVYYAVVVLVHHGNFFSYQSEKIIFGSSGKEIVMQNVFVERDGEGDCIMEPAPIPGHVYYAYIRPDEDGGVDELPLVELEAVCDEEGHLFFKGICTDIVPRYAVLYYNDSGWCFDPINSEVSRAYVTIASGGAILPTPEVWNDYGDLMINHSTDATSATLFYSTDNGDYAELMAVRLDNPYDAGYETPTSCISSIDIGRALLADGFPNGTEVYVYVVLHAEGYADSKMSDYFLATARDD